MTLDEILILDKTQKSLNIINHYLESVSKTSDEYVIALTIKASITHHLGHTKDGINLVLNLLKDTSKLTSKSIVTLCDFMIFISKEIKKYDSMLHYIEYKKKYLGVSTMNQYIKDKYQYYLAINDYENAKNELIEFLNDDITKEEAIEAKIELSEIYYKQKLYDKYIDLSYDIKDYYERNLAIDKLTELAIRIYRINLLNGNYNKIITEGKEYIKTSGIKDNMKLIIASLIMKSYINLNEYKKARIIEGDYEELINKSYKEESIEFVTVAKELANITNAHIYINYYDNLLKELNNINNNIDIIDEDNTDYEIENLEIKKEEINELDISKRRVLNPKEEVIIETKKNKLRVDRNINISKHYKDLIKIFNTINTFNQSLKFRELFRLTCIEICKIYDIEEIYLLYFKRKYLGLHFKKDRAYDKVLEFDNISNTIAYKSYEMNEELIIDNQERLFNINIVTKEEYDDETIVYSIPLVGELETLGSLTFTSHKNFIKEEFTYEAIRLLVSSISLRLNIYLNQELIEYNNKKLFFIKDNMSSGIKEVVDDIYHLSKNLSELLGVFEDLCEMDYLNHLSSSDCSKYKVMKESLYKNRSLDQVLEYDFINDDKKIRLRERFYPLLYEGTIHIVSLIDDISKESNDFNKLKEIAYTNPISKQDTELKLNMDLNKYYNDKKLTLAIFEVNDSKLYKELYGNNFYKQLVFAIGMKLKEIIKDEYNIYLYHLESDRYALLFNNINDKRIIDSKLNNIFNILNTKLSEINKRVSLYFNCGVYRLGKYVNISNEGEIINYAKDALEDTTNIRVDSSINVINHFDSEYYKKKFNNNVIKTHCSEAIDKNKLSIMYQQIIDLNKTEVYGYKLRLNVENYEVSDEVFDYISKRRGLDYRLLKYLIMNSFKEEKLIYDILKGYLDIFIELDINLCDKTIISFIQTQLNYFKIKAEHVTFIIKNGNFLIINELKKLGFNIASYDLLDVYRNHIDYFIYDYHLVGKDSIGEILELCNSKNILCILSNINTLDDVTYIKDNKYSLIYGDYYKKKFNIKQIVDKFKK